MKSKCIHSFLILLIIVFVIDSCGNAQKDKPKDLLPVATTIPHSIVNDSEAGDSNWAGVLVLKYINANKSYFNSLKDKDTIPTDWFFDSRLNTDTAHYLIFEIGHSSEYNFIADRWLYIDSLTKNIYEYHLPNELLTKWNH